MVAVAYLSAGLGVGWAIASLQSVYFRDSLDIVAASVLVLLSLFMWPLVLFLFIIAAWVRFDD